MHVFSPNSRALLGLLSFSLNNQPFYEKWSYLICIINSRSVIGRAQILLEALPYSNSPLPSLLLASFPWNPPLLIPPPSNLLHSLKTQTDLVLHVASPLTHNALGAAMALDVAGSVCAGGSSPLFSPPFLQATDWLAPPAGSHCCGSIWMWSPWQQQQAWPHLLSLSPHAHNLSLSLSFSLSHPLTQTPLPLLLPLSFS